MVANALDEFIKSLIYAKQFAITSFHIFLKLLEEKQVILVVFFFSRETSEDAGSFQSSCEWTKELHIQRNAFFFFFSCVIASFIVLFHSCGGLMWDIPLTLALFKHTHNNSSYISAPAYSMKMYSYT